VMYGWQAPKTVHFLLPDFNPPPSSYNDSD